MSNLVGRRRPRTTVAAPALTQTVKLSAIQKDLESYLHSKLMPGLDALRAIAVTLVLVDHFKVFNRTALERSLSGLMGVMIFFVLSGFLITWMLLKEYHRSGTISIGNFYRRRTFRIFPSFYVCWILTTIVEYFGHRLEWPRAFASFFYLMDYGLGVHPHWMYPSLHMWVSWSLAVEEKFYLLWPLLLLLLLRNRSRITRNLSLIILALWIYRAILFLVFRITFNHFAYTFDMRVDALLVGCLTAIVLENARGRLLFCHLLRWQWLSVLPALALLVVMTTVHPGLNRYVLLPIWTIEPAIVAMMLVQFIYWGSKSWTISATAPVRFIAHISYALYLYHPLASEISGLLHFSHQGGYPP